MYSLYHSLLAQHPRQLMPVPCAASTIAQLHRYFEDVVLENNLGALVVESLPGISGPSRARHCSHQRTRGSRQEFLSCGSALKTRFPAWCSAGAKETTKSVVLERTEQDNNQSDLSSSRMHASPPCSRQCTTQTAKTHRETWLSGRSNLISFTQLSSTSWLESQLNIRSIPTRSQKPSASPCQRQPHSTYSWCDHEVSASLAGTS